MADITLTPDQATAVITEAKKDKIGEGPVYPGSMPDSPDKRVEVATELVGFAIDAYVNDNMRGVEVVDLLKAADVSIDDDGNVSQGGGSPPPAEEPKARDENPTAAASDPAQPQVDSVVLVNPADGSRVEVPESAAAALEAAGFERERPSEPEPPATQRVLIGGTEVELPYEQAQALVAAGTAEAVGGEAPAADPQPADPGHEGTPPAEPSDADAAPADPADDPYAGQELEEPWEGYDTESDVDIRAKMQDFSDEEIAYVKAYEARNKNRKRIGNFKRDPKKASRAVPDEAELDAARQAEAAAEADTGPVDPRVQRDPEPGVSTANDVTMPEEGGDHVPILTAHEERALALAEVEKARLPIPGDIEEPPEFPEDIAGLDDGTLWTLHSKFNACLASATWKLGMVLVDERAFKHIADSKAREVRASLDHTNPATGKPKGRELLEKEAEDSEEVQVWRDKQYQAELRAIPLRRLVDIYSSQVEVLSRQWTFREREAQSSGGLGSRQPQP